MERIYALLPAVYRERDAALGRPLAAVCKVLELEYAHLHDDIAGLYAQWFIETCDPWVVPYLGALVGTTGIDTEVANVPTQRVRVANTLGYRSRRGIASTLASACADASGWPALPVEYVRQVVTSVNVNAVSRAGSDRGPIESATFDVGSPNARESLDGPFATARRSASVGAIDRPRVHGAGACPDYSPRNLGIYLWRTPAYPCVGSDPGRAPDGGHFTFHPLGIDTQLLRGPVGRASPWQPPGPENVPLWVSRSLLGDWTDAWRRARIEGVAPKRLPDLGFTIFVDGSPIPPHAIYAARRGSAPREWLAELERPDGPHAVVDPERGRFVLGGVTSSAVTLDWAWGQGGDLGGGPYPRGARLFRATPDTLVILLSRTLVSEHASAPTFGTLAAAWRAALRRDEQLGRPATEAERDVLIRVLDSATYDAAELELPRSIGVTIEAADGERPTIRADADGVALRVHAQSRARVALSGLLLGGTLEASGELELELADTTVHAVGSTVRPALRWEVRDPRSEPQLRLIRSVVGGLRLSSTVRASVVESIVDGEGGWAIAAEDGGAGPGLELTAATLLGGARVRSLSGAEDTLVTGTVRARTTSLSVLKTARFALELEGPGDEQWSERPEASARALPPAPFVSVRFGDPGYCQLRLDLGDELLRGAAGGAELGAFRAVASGQRLANLQPVLAEYLPWGSRAGIFVTGQAPPRKLEHER